MIDFKALNFPIKNLFKKHEIDVKTIDQHFYHTIKTSTEHMLSWWDVAKLFTNWCQNNERLLYIQALWKNVDVIVVIGIGGSYLGVKAVYDLLYELATSKKIIFAGNNLSSKELNHLLILLKKQKYGLCVISKSGSTVEPSFAFHFWEEQILMRYGQEQTKDYIVVVSEEGDNLLYNHAQKQGYEHFAIPCNIGGRFSIASAVGYVPLTLANINLVNFYIGMKQATKDLTIINNSAYQYAVARYEMFQQHKVNEILALFEPSLSAFGEWYQQLFAESEGKNQKGLYPLKVVYPADLHSWGQMIQDGQIQFAFETFLSFISPNKTSYRLQNNDINCACKNDLAHHDLATINQFLRKAVQKSHCRNNFFCFDIVVHQIVDECFMLGYLMYWMMRACAMSAMLLQVNPFNQPGVNEYKKHFLKQIREFSIA